MFSTLIIWIIQFISLYAIIFWLLLYFDKGTSDKDFKKLNHFPIISIAVPAYNEKTTIKETIKSLLNLDYPKEKLELFVINDCSTDNTKNIIENIVQEHKIITLIDNKKNIGKAASLNKALKRAKGKFFICLDADSFIEKDALNKMLPHFKNKEIASVIPRIYIRNTSKFILRFQWVEYIITFFFKKLMGHIDCIHVTPGPFSIYRKEVIKRLGGFDEGNLTEDLEMAFKLQKHNYKIKQVLNIAASTIAPDTIYGFYRQRNRWFKGALLNIIKYKKLIFNKNYKEFGLFQLPMIIFTSLASISIVYFLFYNQILKSLFNNISQIPNIGFFYQINIPHHIKNFLSNLYLTDLFSFNKFLFLYFLLILGFIFLFCAFKSAKFPIRQHGILPIMCYLVVYPLVTAAIWSTVFFDLIINKKQKW